MNRPLLKTRLRDGIVLAIGMTLTSSSVFADGSARGRVSAEKQVAGMSIVGNDESPKSLVIVPWKGSDLGDGVDVSRRLAQDRSPVDREVFERSLHYYEIRAEGE
jgi:hypothetical protein